MSILDFFPAGKTPRPAQVQLLLQIEARWDANDVICITAPTAVGKTEISLAVAHWQAARGNTANILTPANVLVDQTLERYPDLQALHRQDAYYCDEWKRSCSASKAKLGGFCKGCPCAAAKRDTKKASVRLMNYHVYWAHRLYAHTLIFDEAHQLVDMLADKQQIRLWQTTYEFPNNLKTVSDVISWGQQYLLTDDDAKLRAAILAIIKIRDGATVEYRRMWYRGHESVVLHVLPAPSTVPPYLWPSNKVRKIVLMSATTGPQDVRDLGLDNRRVCYLECDSPIPAASRPFIHEPAYNMSYKYVDKAMPHAAAKLRELMDRYGAKGLVHIPYGLAIRLRELIDDPRLIWHDRDNKAEALELFRNSPPESGRVLIASGLYEGIDLPYEAAYWQFIVKVPFLSLASDAVKDRANKDPDWYAWSAIKLLLQAAGRIVRAADDSGITIIGDVNFKRLYDADTGRKQRLFPKFFRDAVRIRKGAKS